MLCRFLQFALVANVAVAVAPTVAGAGSPSLSYAIDLNDRADDLLQGDADVWRASGPRTTSTSSPPPLRAPIR